MQAFERSRINAEAAYQKDGPKLEQMEQLGYPSVQVALMARYMVGTGSLKGGALRRGALVGVIRPMDPSAIDQRLPGTGDFEDGANSKAGVAMRRALLAAVCGNDFVGIDRRFVLRAIHTCRPPSEFVAELKDRADADPWLRQMVLGEAALQKVNAARRRRSAMDGSSGKENGDGGPQLAEAQEHFAEALKLQPAYPEAAFGMMQVAAYSGKEPTEDGQGGLIGTCDAAKAFPIDPRGMMLLCQAKIGRRFELRGHAEILEAGTNEGSFGAVAGYADARRFWECFFYPPRSHETAGHAKVEIPFSADLYMSIPNLSHSRYAKVGRSDDFRIVLYDDRVVTMVGDETRAEQGPFAIVLDNFPPTDATPFGISGSPPFTLSGNSPNVVRFTKLELKKLTEPPPAIGVVKPGADGAGDRY